MQVIGFFNNLFSQFGNLTSFVMSPINDITGQEIAVFGHLSIAELLSISIGLMLVTILTFRVIRLFIGG